MHNLKKLIMTQRQSTTRKIIIYNTNLSISVIMQLLNNLSTFAKKTTKRDGAGNMLSAGITLDFPGQDYHWWRETLLRQNGGAPYSDDNKKVTYDSEAGAKSLNWYADLQRVHKVGQVGFMAMA